MMRQGSAIGPAAPTAFTTGEAPDPEVPITVVDRRRA